MRASTLTRFGVMIALFGAQASCDFLAGDEGGPGAGPGAGGSNPGFQSPGSLPLSTLRVTSKVGAEANLGSYIPVVSRNGLFAVFASDANNLVPNDTNNATDIFVVDLTTGLTERVNVTSAGVQTNLNAFSWYPAISGDGQFVVFYSQATNLVLPDNNGSQPDIYLHDRNTDETTRVTIHTDGTQGNQDSYQPSISDDGQYISYQSWSSNLVDNDFNFTSDIFVYNRDVDGPGGLAMGDPANDSTTRVSIHTSGAEADSSSHMSQGSALSLNGRRVVFISNASNLVDDDTNFTSDVFLHDQDLGTTVRVSVLTDGTQADAFSSGAAISADGEHVAFYTYASNLAPNDTNGVFDVYAWDLATGAVARVSSTNAGFSGNSDSYVPTISDGGRFVSFFSYASNLVPGDTNFTYDVFLRDRDLDGPGGLPMDAANNTSMKRASVDTFLNQGNSSSFEGSMSASGSIIVFSSYASNLILGDSNFQGDIFVYNRDTDGSGGLAMDAPGNVTTSRVSQGPPEGGNSTSQDPSVDATGLIVAFTSFASNLVPVDAGGFPDVFVRDVTGGPCTLVSVNSAGAQGNGSSQRPSQSANGRFVAFDSTATNLDPNDFNGGLDVFVRDLTFGITTRVSVNSLGQEAIGPVNGAPPPNNFPPTSFAPSISSDGRFVAFVSDAINLADDNGDDVFNDDTNNTTDVFVHDRQTGQTKRVSLNSAGGQGNSFSQAPSISPDGRYVAFESGATNFIDSDNDGLFDNDTNGAIRDIFVHDTLMGTTTVVSVDSGGLALTNASCFRASISNNGRYIAFDSGASNLVPGDALPPNFTDVFVHDLVTRTTVRVSINSDGALGNNTSVRASISEDGRYVAFDSAASNFVDTNGDGVFDEDTNGFFDIFRHDRDADNDGVFDEAGAVQTLRVSVSSLGAQANGSSTTTSTISADGRFIAFQTNSTNLTPEDTSSIFDIYLRGPLH